MRRNHSVFLAISAILMVGAGPVACRRETATAAPPVAPTPTSSADEEVTLSPQGLRRIARFPVSDAEKHLRFDEVASFRLGAAVEIDLDEIREFDASIGDASGLVFGTKLSGAPRPLKPFKAKQLAEFMRSPKHVTNTQARPWAGGAKVKLVAFDAAGKPLFLVDLQTTTPSEIAFCDLRPVHSDLVRDWIDAEFEQFFYYEVTDYRIAAHLFAIALELQAAGKP
jgi:hypothetical protein